MRGTGWSASIDGSAKMIHNSIVAGWLPAVRYAQDPGVFFGGAEVERAVSHIHQSLCPARARPRQNAFRGFSLGVIQRMSTRIMSLCWPLRMSPPAKAVLIALADNANDAGFCWPSIESICERTCFCRTTVIAAIKWLESAGFLVANRDNGRKTTYTVVTANQSATRTGTANEPVRQTAQTSTPDAPDQYARRTLTVNNRHKNRQDIKRPRDVPDQVWTDFLAIRKAKKSPLTETALAGIEREACKAGLSIGDALAMCCERGWQGFKADWCEQSKPRAGPKRSAAVESFLALTSTRPDDFIDV